MKHDLVGRIFGTLTVIRFDPDCRPERTRWFCKCKCGTEKSIMTQNLISGDVRSCGRGLCHPNAKHGGRIKRDPEYSAWCSMKQRCYDTSCKNYHLWGGRGITICPQWKNNYPQFLADVGKRPSSRHCLDRKDNNGHYEPGNVRWVLPVVQQNNKRSNRIIEYRGIRKSAAQWSLAICSNRNLVSHRIDKGWSVELAVTQPPRHW